MQSRVARRLRHYLVLVLRRLDCNAWEEMRADACSVCLWTPTCIAANFAGAAGSFAKLRFGSPLLRRQLATLVAEPEPLRQTHIRSEG